ncbi:uncharacterized protein QC763_207070 [Podospora pseudopauciseta]|uniref:Uncharacterized protein n=1 Tax=Podospora pseudopauciseta TaxID=2093780 RepID=A0ABR0HPW1_9PEZI|nr:hypothetical protein QC763_207070 [Podospora pseudopauciseta]
MPTHARTGSRSSIDRVFELLGDLEEADLSLLLDDLNHTTESNVPVSQAIALFEKGPSRSNKKYERASSPVRNLQAELERRHSKRLSMAPQPRPQSIISSPLKDKPDPLDFSFPSTSLDLSLDFSSPTSPSLSPPALSPSGSPTSLPSLDESPRPSSRPELPSLITLSLPENETATRPLSVRSARSGTGSALGSRPRSYKRIDRPTILSPTATAELHALLLAYLNDSSSSETSTATPSPTTPLPSLSSSIFSFRHPDDEPEPMMPGLDLLEPSPTRTPYMGFGSLSGGNMGMGMGMGMGGSLKPKASMSSIFEIMGSH